MPIVKEIAHEVFTLFKKRTDGVNKNQDKIAPTSIQYYRKIPLEEIVEAFQLLQLRNLIASSPDTYSYFQLTSIGKSQPDDIFEKIVDKHGQ